MCRVVCGSGWIGRTRDRSWVMSLVSALVAGLRLRCSVRWSQPHRAVGMVALRVASAAYSERERVGVGILCVRLYRIRRRMRLPPARRRCRRQRRRRLRRRRRVRCPRRHRRPSRAPPRRPSRVPHQHRRHLMRRARRRLSRLRPVRVRLQAASRPRSRRSRRRRSQRRSRRPPRCVQRGVHAL